VVENFIDTSEDYMKNTNDKPGVKRVGLVVVSLFLAVLIFAAAGCTGGGNNAPAPIDTVAPPPPVSGGNDDVMVEPGDAAQAKKSEKAKKSKKESAEKTEDESVVSIEDEKMVTMVVPDSGRADPFQPIHEAIQDPDAAAKAAAKERAMQEKVLSDAKLKYDLVEPPNGSSPNTDADKVMTTKVSGIIYDADSPSAILNIEGSDYLVRSGDVVNGYKILAIGKTVVTVQYGANMYKAGVGELLATDGIQYNTISNLENKFGGSGRK